MRVLNSSSGGGSDVERSRNEAGHGRDGAAPGAIKRQNRAGQYVRRIGDELLSGVRVARRRRLPAGRAFRTAVPSALKTAIRPMILIPVVLVIGGLLALVLYLDKRAPF
jgi:hypothetical protein